MKQMKRALSLLLCLAMLAAYVPVPALAETEGGEEHQHSWDQGVVTAPGCESAGFTTYTCADCGNTKQEDEVAALGHSWGEWMVTQEPTELAEGSRERTCGICSKKETGAIDKLPSVPPVVAAASVTVTQAQNYTEVIVTDTLQLTALVLPEDTTDKTVIWTSSDESIATVDAAGLVTGEALGDVIITAACGEVTGSYALAVVMPEHSVLAAYAGACGDELKWRLDTYTGKLTITGTGAMYDYANSADAHAPWYSYADTIKTVEIASGATRIGNYAFHNCSKMTSIVIPDTVTSFGNAAFQGCGKLASISIPYGVNSIGEHAFNACYLIEKFLVDANNRYYSSDNTGALYNKDKTVLIKAPAGIYGPYTIPDGVITIGFNAFGATNSMMSVTIPDSVTTIGDQAFFACQLLKSVEIPANVTSIGKEAFLSCTDLKSITLSSGVSSIGDFAFHSCENLTDIYYYGTEAQWEAISIGNYNAPLLSATIHYADPCADGHAFDANHKCTDCGYIGGTCGTDLTWNFDESTGTLTISGNGDMVDYGKRNVSGSADEPDTAKIPWYGIRSQIKSVVTEFGVSHLGNFAFYDCSAMESITITTSVSSIGYGMVQQCRLKDVYYTATEEKWNSLTIGSGQTGFSSAVMHFNVTDPANHWSPERVEATCTENGYKQEKCACGHTRNYQILFFSGSHNYGSGAKCTVCGHIGGTCGDNLTWEFDSATKKLTISGTGAMYDYIDDTPWISYISEIKTVEIGSGVTSIGYSAFFDCSSLENVQIPASVKSIGGYAFGKCAKLSQINIPSGVTIIAQGAFYGCSNLKSVKIPSGVTEIQDYAFNKCSGLGNIEIPSSVTEIGGYAFSECYNLWHVSYTGTKEQWDAVEFTYGNERLEDACLHINWRDDVTLDLENQKCPTCVTAFKIKMYDVGKNGWSENRIEVWVDNVLMDTVTLSSGGYGTWTMEYDETKSYRFVWRKSLDHYTHEQCGCDILLGHKVVFSKDYSYFTNCYDLTTLYSICNHNWQSATCTQPKTCSKCGEKQGTVLGHSYTQNVANQEFLKTAATCKDKAVYYKSCICGAQGAETFEYGDVGDHTRDANHKCSQCGHIGGTCGDNLEWTFDSATGKLTISGTGAMNNYVNSAPWNSYRNNIQSVEIASGVTTIGNYAFGGCANMESISIPNTVTSIGNSAFEYGNKLTSIEIPASVTSIGSYAFRGCTYLAEIVIPASVTSMGANVFSENSDLLDVYFGGTRDNWSHFGVTYSNEKAVTHYGVTNPTGHWVDNNKAATCTDSGYTGKKCGCGHNRIESTIPAGHTMQNNICTRCGYAGGTCGENVNWEFDSTTGKLTIFGTGDMDNYFHTYSRYAPWYGFAEDVKQVTIKDGVTSIGSLAFYGCSNLASLALYEDVASVGEQAFSGCSSLKTVALPNAVTSIGEEAFYNCSGMTYVYFFGGVTTIGSKTFFGCSSLKSITLPESVTSIGEHAFYNCSSLKTIQLSEKITTIGASAFFGCSSLESVAIPSKVTAIEQFTFYGCQSLKTLEIPSGVARIGTQSFDDCSSLERIDIPASVTSIGDYAFDGCAALTVVNFLGNVPTMLNSPFDDLTLTAYYPVNNATWTESARKDYGGTITWVCIGCKDGHTYVYTDHYDGKTHSKECSVCGDTVASENHDFGYVGLYLYNAICDCGAGICGDDLTWYITDDGVITLCGSGAMYDFYNETSVESSSDSRPHVPWAENYRGQITGVVIPSGVTHIGANAFRVSGRVVSGSVVHGTTIKEVTIPAMVKTIGEGAFAGCQDLRTVNLSAGLETIGDSAFSKCDLYSLSVPNTVTSIGDYAFSGCEDLETVTIPGSVKTIGEQAFYGCRLSSIYTSKAVVLEEGIETIGRGAFARSRIKNVTIPESVTSLGGGLFSECRNLQSVKLPSSLTEIPGSLFYYCENLRSVDIPSGVTSIGNSAFAHSGLSSLELPAGLTSIGDNAFAYMVLVDEIVIPAQVTSIGSLAFMANDVHVVKFLGDPPSIKENAFSAVEADVYYYDNGLWTQSNRKQYGGTLSWIPMGAQCGDNLTWSFDAATDTLTISGTGDMADYTQSNKAPWANLGSRIKNLVIAEGVTGIGDYAFSDCSALETASFPSTLTSVGDSAFYKEDSSVCKGFWSTINQTVDQWRNVQLGENNEYFPNWNSVNFVNQSPTTASGKAGEDVYWKLDGEGNMTFFGSGPMYDFGDLASPYGELNVVNVEIAEGVTTIGGSLFEVLDSDIPHTSFDCITIGSTVTSVGDVAFSNCYALTTIIFTGDAPDFGTNCFRGVIATAYYPADTEGWDSKAGNNYGGKITWVKDTCRNAHTETLVKGTPATCTEPGLTDGKQCSACNTVLDAQEEIPAGHTGKVSVCPICKAYGYCGENLIWTLDDAGTLSITGTGDMYHYTDRTGGPWFGSREQIKKVVIGTGATAIGNYAFYDCTKLEEIAIPEGVISIGTGSFRYCSNLKGITLPQSLTSIGSLAFGNSFTMEELVLPGGLTSIGAGAFEYCSGLKEITIPVGVTQIGADTFKRCTGLAEVTLPRNLTSIGNYAFANCGFTEIEIPGKVNSIGDCAFSTINAKSKLTKITFTGACPTFAPGYDAKNVFLGVTATAYYPAGHETWTSDVRQGYGGELTWVARQLDPETYGVKIGETAVTDAYLSGDNWRYDPDTNTLHLDDGFNSTISTTRPSLIIEVSGTATAASIIATGTNITLRAKANSSAQPVLDVNQRGIIVTGGNLTVEKIKLTVTHSYEDTISVTAENGEGGTLTVNNAWLSASATGENSVSAIDVVNLIVNGSSCVYGSTSRQGVDAIYIGESGSFSSACHVEATANNGNGIMGYGMTFPAYAYIRDTELVDGSTDFAKLSTASVYSGGRIETSRSYEFIGLDHAAYVQNGDTHKLVCKCVNPTTVFPAEAHTWSHSLNGADTIAAECTKCEASGSVTLVPPQELVSDGTNAREAAIEGSIPGVTPVITYEGTTLVEGKPVHAGTYTAKVTLGGKTAAIEFELAADPMLTAVATVTVGTTVTPYDTLTDAAAAASAASGSTLKLLQDVTVDKTVNITSGKFTLDLNDKTLHSEYWEVLKVTGGELCITDTGTDTSKGGITTTGSMSAAVWIDGAKVTISGIGLSASSLSSSYGVRLDAGDLSVSDCAFTVRGSNFAYGISAGSGAGTLSVSDCTINSRWGISFNGTTASITDCTIEGREVGVYVGTGQMTIAGSDISGPIGVLVADENAVVDMIGSNITAVGSEYDSGNASGVGVNSGTVNLFGCTISATKERYGTGYGVNVSDGSVNITGGFISGNGADLMIDGDGTITLCLPAMGDAGASFPGGIQVEGTTLMDILGSGASYWVGTQEQSLAADATQITGDVTVRKHTQHSYNGFAADKTTGETHTRVCIFCGEELTENHAYTETVAEADYLKSEATCTEPAVYYKSCQCGAAGTETFTDGKPLDHTFDQEVAGEKYLKSEATCTEPAVYYKSCQCGATGTETFTGGKPLDHTFDQEVAGEKYLKSEATCTEPAVYYRSCKCGATGTETFTDGKPLDHTFDQEVAEEKYLKSEATHTSAAVYYKSCKCGKIGSDTFTYGEPLTGSIVRIPTADLEGSTSVWIDGIQYPVVTDGEMSYVTLPNESVTLMITYTYHVGDANDVHTQYPTGMKVWQVTRSDAGCTAKHLGALDNILQYKGSSIRITGNKGIRMITAVPTSKKAALTGAGLEGYKLLEYGTVLSWASALADGSPLVLGPDYAKYNYAYKKDVADPVFAYTGDTVQYTNVLVGFTNDQCKDDIAMRSYMILEDAQGNQVTLYGGIVYRSIGYIAYQNRAAFGVGSAAYEYVWEIIHHVYGDQYDSEYRG